MEALGPILPALPASSIRLEDSDDAVRAPFNPHRSVGPDLSSRASGRPAVPPVGGGCGPEKEADRPREDVLRPPGTRRGGTGQARLIRSLSWRSIGPANMGGR